MRAGRTKLPHISTIRLNVIIILYKYPPIVMNTFGAGPAQLCVLMNVENIADGQVVKMNYRES